MLRVQSVFTGLPGMPGISSTYFSGAGAVDAQTAVNRVRAFWDGLFVGLSDGLVIQIAPDVYEIDPEDGVIFDIHAIAGETWTGGSADEVLPFATQVNLSFLTAGVVRGRRVRGRNFIPGYVEGSNVDGALTVSASGALEALATTTLGDTSDPMRQLVWSRPTLTDAGSSHEVTSYLVPEQFAVLRSRRP